VYDVMSHGDERIVAAADAACRCRCGGILVESMFGLVGLNQTNSGHFLW